MTTDSFLDKKNGLEAASVSEMQHLYGPNIIEITVLPVYKMILKEVSNPFYFFQIYTIIVWMAQQYYDYSAMVMLATIIAVGSSVMETRKVSWFWRLLKNMQHLLYRISLFYWRN